jgi:hypothetical protein
MRPAGTQTWGKTLLLEGGTACQAGFDYPQVSVAFAAPASTIDVKLVPTGSRCDAGALTEGDGLALATGVVTTLVRIGGAGTPEQILALPEDAPQTSGSFVRFVHAAPGLGSLDFGTTINTTLPASLTQSLFAAPVAFGAVSPAGNATCCNLTVDDHGYLHLPAVEVRFAAATTPTGSALWVWTCSGRAATFSVYTIGVQGDATHPIEAVACNEGAFAPTAVGQTLSCQTQP